MSPPSPSTWSSSWISTIPAETPFQRPNLRVGEHYLKVKLLLFPLCYFKDDDVPENAELIHVLRNGERITVIERNQEAISKFGPGVQPSEEQAMRLVSEYTIIPIPRVFTSEFRSDSRQIMMSLIPGTSLYGVWASLSDGRKYNMCHQIWALLHGLRFIVRPPECEELFQCNADGSLSQHPLLEDLHQPSQEHLYTDQDVRARIYKRYLQTNDRRYEHTLPNMLPRAAASIFTHGDIHPRNIMVDDKRCITGILDWSQAGWYPDYWEFAQIMRPGSDDDVVLNWQNWMFLTAPRKWKLSGLSVARSVLI